MLNAGEMMVRLGVHGASGTRQQEVYSKFMELLQLRLAARLQRMVAPGRFDTMSSEPSEDALQSFIETNAPEYRQLVDDESELVLIEFAHEYDRIAAESLS